MTNDRRILVLGSSGYGKRISAFEWQSLPAGLNVADYDAVILDFTRVAEMPISIPRHLPPAEDFARLVMRSESVVFAVGDPRSEFRTFVQTQSGQRGRGHWAGESVTWWLPCHLPAQDATGEVIIRIHEDVASWFKNISSYSWHFTGRPVLDERAQSWVSVVPQGLDCSVSWKPLASTRYHEPLAVHISARVARHTRGSQPQQLVDGSPVLWVPGPQRISAHDAIKQFLRDTFKAGLEAPEPDWAPRYRLPQHLAAVALVQQKKLELEAAIAAVRETRSAAEAAGRMTKLLYEQGEDALEPIAREALSILGAEVTEPARRGIEDGRFSLPDGRQGMLEIKGRSGQLALEDVRQLNGWMADALATEEWSGKGLIIANTQLALPPDQRNDYVASNALRFAKNVRICVLPTPQLFQALVGMQNGTLDKDAFWNTVFATTGVTSLPSVAPPAEPLPE